MVRVFQIYSLNNVQVYIILLSHSVTMFNLFLLFNWNLVQFDQR